MPGLMQRTLWFSVLLLAGLLVLLVAVFFGFGGTLPALRPLPLGGETVNAVFPQRSFEGLFATSALPPLTVPSNAINPFYTLYFQPPPPPPTKKVQLVYAGCVVSSTGLHQAYVRLGDTLLILTNGAKVVADHAIQNIAVKSVTLTNAAGQTNVIEFNVPKALEVPAS